MSAWNINFNSSNAEEVYEDIKKGKHLSGFSAAVAKLNALRGKLQSMLNDAEWWGGKCQSSAEHYDYAQQQLKDHPNDFSEESAREVNSKSPAMLYDYASALSEGVNKIKDAIEAVDSILEKLDLAENKAKEESGKILKKITNAIDLMDSYLHVEF